jgi:hypothetical protein
MGHASILRRAGLQSTRGTGTSGGAYVAQSSLLMPLIALLSANERAADGAERALMRFGAHSLIEYQARQALALGAKRIILFTQSSSPSIPQIVDRLSARGDVRAVVARDMPALGREIGPDDDILLIADGLVAPQGALAALTGKEAAHLLVVPMTAATSAFERIDPVHGWAGAARLRGRIALDTLDMLGEWDLSSTLVRAAIQAGAHRLELAPDLVTDGRLALLDRQEAADLAFDMLTRAGDADRSGLGWRGLDGWLSQRLGPWIARKALRRQIPSIILRQGAAALSALSLPAAALGWPGLAMPVALGGLALSGTAAAMEALSREDPPARWLAAAPLIATLLLIALIGHALSPPTAGAMGLIAATAPALLCGLIALVERQNAPSAMPGWVWPSPAVVVTALLLSWPWVAGGLVLFLLCLLSAVILGSFIATESRPAEMPNGSV